MQNIPLNQLSPEMIQMLLTQGMFQPIEQANPYVNMIDPNTIPMDQLAYSYNLNLPYDQQSALARRAILNEPFKNPNLINNNMTLNEVNNLRPEGSRMDDAVGMRNKLQQGAYELKQKGML